MKGRTKDGGTFVKGLQTRSDKTTRNAQSLMFTLYCKTSIPVRLYPKSKCPPSKIAFLGFVSWHFYFSSLSEPFTHQATEQVRWCRTREVIPVTVCPDWHRGSMPSPHVAAWFPGFSIRFIWSPGFVDWNRVITPVKVVSGPHQADPHLFPCWCRLPRDGQDKLVFPRIGNLYQVSSQSSTELLGLVPSHGCAACIIAKAVELPPSPRAIG